MNGSRVTLAPDLTLSVLLDELSKLNERDDKKYTVRVAEDLVKAIKLDQGCTFGQLKIFRGPAHAPLTAAGGGWGGGVVVSGGGGGGGGCGKNVETMNSREIAQEATQRARLPQHLEAVTKAMFQGSEIGTWDESLLSAELEDLVQDEGHRQQVVACLLDMKRDAVCLTRLALRYCRSLRILCSSRPPVVVLLFLVVVVVVAAAKTSRP